MSESKAVFLSYCSDDAAAAQRVAESLREAGISVWFDRDELRGGDAWDNSIRKQIRECALFVPVISANTEEREEGYFRREWNLAVERTLDMLEGKPFLVPVVIDETSERDGKVPAKFRSVQWTKLTNGNPSPAFVAHVQRLVRRGTQASASNPITGVETSAPSAQATRSRRRFVYGLGTLATLALAIAAWFLFDAGHRSEPSPPATQAIPEKSIAVLPFIDTSEKKDQEYFSDGLADELLQLLGRLPDLRVAARTSAFSFKGKPDDIQTIAHKLLVAYVLEGSVRRAGNMLRISVQLVRASNGYQVWSQTYDRKVDDIFKIQDEIASAVARELKTSLGAGAAPAKTGTGNKEAYFLFLRAREAVFRGRDYAKAAKQFQEITKLDPGYAPAWAWLSNMLQSQMVESRQVKPDEHIWEDARNAALKAISLDPQEPTGYVSLGQVLMEHDRDFSGARAQYERARALDPNDWSLLLYSAILERALANFDEAIAIINRSVAVDPLNGLTYGLLAETSYLAGRIDEAQYALDRVKNIYGEYSWTHFVSGKIALARGKYAEAIADFERMRPESAGRAEGLVKANFSLDKRSESDAVLASFESKHADDDSLGIAAAHAYRGEIEPAIQWLERAYRQREELDDLKSDPDFKSLRTDPRYQQLLRKLRLS